MKLMVIISRGEGFGAYENYLKAVQQDSVDHAVEIIEVELDSGTQQLSLSRDASKAQAGDIVTLKIEGKIYPHHTDDVMITDKSIVIQKLHGLN